MTNSCHFFSEKAWKALEHCMIPVILGPKESNVQDLLPPNSYLHVDNFSNPTQLAKWIQYLDTNYTAFR